MMRTRSRRLAPLALAALVGGLLAVPSVAAEGPVSVTVWVTDPGTNTYLAQQSSVPLTTGRSSAPVKITVTPTTTYQSVTGFGASFTDSSAWLIDQHLSPAKRADLMQKLFNPTTGIGMTLLRQPMSATDFNAPTSGTAGLYTYDDMPIGQSDPGLTHFSIAHDEAYILPELREALAVNPDLTIMATPWSPPGWMRANGQTLGMVGGSLKPEAYADWALYFVKFIQAYQAAGVPIDYMTPQNEPLNELILLPSMRIGAPDEALLIRNHLGPALRAAGLSTKILGYDFTWDNTYYPTALFADPLASSYLAGTAWHCYGGNPGQMSPIHDLAPTKETFVTECSGLRSSPPEFVVTDASQLKKTMNLFIDSTRNWANGVILWNIALDSFNGPSNGCVICRPLVSIDYNLFEGWGWHPAIEYYAMGQVAKFVRPGAVRVDSTTSATGINNASFVNADGSRVVVAVNNGSAVQTFAVQWGGQFFSYTLNAGATATFTLPA